MTSSVSSKHMSWLPARRSLPLHQKLSTLPLLKARSNSIYFYLKGFVGSAHGCYSMVCMTSTQFTKMTNRPSAEFTVHVYPLHFMFWTHQNLKKKEQSECRGTSKNWGAQQAIKPLTHPIAVSDVISEFFIFSLSSTFYMWPCQWQPADEHTVSQGLQSVNLWQCLCTHHVASILQSTLWLIPEVVCMPQTPYTPVQTCKCNIQHTHPVKFNRVRASISWNSYEVFLKARVAIIW